MENQQQIDKSRFSQDADKRLRQLSDEDQRYWIAQVFRKLLAMFGEVGRRQYAVGDPTDMHNEWIAGLLNYRIKEIAYGLEAARGRKYPPHLGEMCALCDLAPKAPEDAPKPKPPRPSRDAMNTLTTGLMQILQKPRALDTDPRAWARDIVARWEAGDLNNYAAYETACAALNAEPGPRRGQRRFERSA